MVRDYSGPSLRDLVMKAQTYEELQEVRKLLRAADGMSSGTRRKLEKLVRRQELVLPNRPRLLIPA